MEYFFYSTIYLSYFFLLAALVTGILKYSYLKKYEKGYVFYLIYTFFIEATVLVFTEYLQKQQTSFVYPFYIGGIFCILSFLYLKKLTAPKIWLIILPALGIIYLIIHRFTDLFNHDYIKVISNIIIFCLAGLSLLQELRKTKIDNRFLWVDAFIFLYYSVSAFIFVVHSKLGNMELNSAYTIWGMNNILTCVLYFTFINTFLKLKK